MKLVFNGITLGGGPNYFLDGDPDGLSGDLNNINIKIPRTDYSQNVADYLNTKVRSFSGTIVGSNVNDFRTRKRSLANMLRSIYSFSLVDDIKNSDGSITVFETYIFSGKITLFDVDKEIRSTMSKFDLQITSEDPFLYLATPVIITASIDYRGFPFPLIFPFVFTGSDNSMVINNPGLVTVYPVITINGPGTNFTIINENETIGNSIFTYNSTLNPTDVLVITPNPIESIKAKKNGISAIADTNSNWDALALKPGLNVFTFFVDSGKASITQATLNYQPAFLGI